MRTLFLISFFVVHSFSLWAVEGTQQPTEYTKEDCQQLIDEAASKVNNRNYLIALEKLLRAELIADKNHWEDKLWLIKNRIGLVYTDMSNFEEALNYYIEAFEITQKHSVLHEKSVLPLSNIGSLHLKEKNYIEALHYFQEAYEIVKKSNQKTYIKGIAVNLSVVYNNLNEIEKSFEILDEVKEPVDDHQINFFWEASYIKALLAAGQTEEASRAAKKLYENYKAGSYDNSFKCQVCVYMMLANLYEELNNLDLAITYTEKALKVTNELVDYVRSYELISRLHEKKGNYQLALHYKDSLVKAVDSLNSLTSKTQYEINKVKFKVIEYQTQAKAERERQLLYRKLLILSVVIFTIIVFLVYFGMKNKARLKQERLKNSIAKKNRELSAKALYFSHRNELIQNIISSFKNSDKSTLTNEVVQQMNEVKRLLETDKNKEDFLKHFESVNPSFLKKLKEKHPKLNANDLRFLCYVYMNLNLKEISIVFNTTYDACRIRRTRILKKMELKNSTSLYNYLLKI